VTREPLPPPLPPETRTVGQLVAESLRLYGNRFLLVLPLGVPMAVADLLASGGTTADRVAVLVIFAPLLSATYAAASAIVSSSRPGGRRWFAAILLGTLVFVPAAIFFPWFALLSVAWLALLGLVVPVAMIEAGGPWAVVRRAVALARADYVHAVGSLATLVIVFVLTRLALAFVLRAQGDNTIRVAIFLSDLVVSPLLFLGAALLYVDQAARAAVRSRPAT
jgi:hypothetical protein